MALTEAQKLKIARILGVTFIDVNDKITNLGTTWITAEVETQIEGLIDEWEAGVNRNVTKIRPREANFGAEIDPSEKRAQIRQELAGLLYMTELMSRQNYGESRLTRC